MKFRKRPVVVEAVQVSKILAAADSGEARKLWPSWIMEAFEKSVISFKVDSVVIKTLEGDHLGEYADWIIRGVKGELYPCKPDIFEATYEPA